MSSNDNMTPQQRMEILQLQIKLAEAEKEKAEAEKEKAEAEKEKAEAEKELSIVRKEENASKTHENVASAAKEAMISSGKWADAAKDATNNAHQLTLVKTNPVAATQTPGQVTDGATTMTMTVPDAFPTSTSFPTTPAPAPAARAFNHNRLAGLWDSQSYDELKSMFEGVRDDAMTLQELEPTNVTPFLGALFAMCYSEQWDNFKALVQEMMVNDRGKLKAFLGLYHAKNFLVYDLNRAITADSVINGVKTHMEETYLPFLKKGLPIVVRHCTGRPDFDDTGTIQTETVPRQYRVQFGDGASKDLDVKDVMVNYRMNPFPDDYPFNWIG